MTEELAFVRTSTGYTPVLVLGQLEGSSNIWRCRFESGSIAPLQGCELVSVDEYLAEVHHVDVRQ